MPSQLGKPHKVPFSLRNEMKNQIQDMLDKGIIEELTTPWSVPGIFVPKKPKYRFCVDFRALNAVTSFDSYPLPLIDETVSTL
jgi:hypothetical protein